MPFDYFNPSHLAFGSKLTKAFRQLEKLCATANENMDAYIKDLEYLGQYKNRNYRIPAPTTSGSPVRTDEALDLVNDEIIIKEIEYNNDLFTVAINYFNRGTNRFTIGKGSTDLKEGYACMSQSVSNSNPTSEIRFVEEESDIKGLYLFKYRIDSNNVINLTVSNETVVRVTPLGVNHINNLVVGQRITLPYTATDYEAIMVLGQKSSYDDQYSINIKVGDKQITTRGFGEKAYHMVYVKPKQKVTASAYDKAYKIIYNTAE